MPVPSSQARQKDKPFSFTQVDMALLEQAELLDKKFEEEGLIYKEAQLNTYIDKIGQSILPQDNPPDRVSWQFRILREPLANAFALPNGSIYLSTGLLALLENESQLASVLAHEVTHVINRHAFLQNRDMRKKMLTINLIQISSTWLPVKSSLGMLLPLFATTTTTQYLLIFAIFGYSRELEKEADLVAVNTLLESPYNPKEMIRTLKLLEMDFEADAAPIFYNDHPELQDRLTYVNQAIQGRPSAATSPELLSKEQITYLSKTENVTRHNIGLNFNHERYRTALASSQKLVNVNPSSENVFLLAESYRLLGPLTMEPSGEELSRKGRKEKLKTKRKLTPEELEVMLMMTPKGQQALKNNRINAELQYRKSIELDPNNPKPYRGLGMLFEHAKQYKEAVENYRRYLEMDVGATDALLIRNRIEKLERIGLQNTGKQ
jgi:beta-barrel assembly-enhancing protease